MPAISTIYDSSAEWILDSPDENELYIVQCFPTRLEGTEWLFFPGPVSRKFFCRADLNPSCPWVYARTTCER